MDTAKNHVVSQKTSVPMPLETLVPACATLIAPRATVILQRGTGVPTRETVIPVRGTVLPKCDNAMGSRGTVVAPRGTAIPPHGTGPATKGIPFREPEPTSRAAPEQTRRMKPTTRFLEKPFAPRQSLAFRPGMIISETGTAHSPAGIKVTRDGTACAMCQRCAVKRLRDGQA